MFHYVYTFIIINRSLLARLKTLPHKFDFQTHTPDFNGHVTKADGTWKKSFRFRLEAAQLADFQNEVNNVFDKTLTKSIISKFFQVFF